MTSVLFIFRVCFLHTICVKHIENLLQYNTADCVGWGPQLTLLIVVQSLSRV